MVRRARQVPYLNCLRILDMSGKVRVIVHNTQDSSYDKKKIYFTTHIQNPEWQPILN